MHRSRTDLPAAMSTITDNLVADLASMTFTTPVTHTYNPLVYARRGFDAYLQRFGRTSKSVVFLGMNPGPFGMAQTGVPFGDVEMVKKWMGISADVSQPTRPHPKRPVDGFDCKKREVSGRRLWGLAKHRFGRPEAFFERFLVLNYCPLAFMEATGRNRTPDRLPAGKKQQLFAVCDRALRQSVALYRPRWVVGIGRFAEQRARSALVGMTPIIGRISHPSPANPKANRGWEVLVESELEVMGIKLAG